MNVLLTVIQVLISILLSVSILLQSKGAGIGGTFGGSSAFVHTRRGVEKVLFNATIILAILFVVVSVANFLFS